MNDQTRILERMTGLYPVIPDHTLSQPEVVELFCITHQSLSLSRIADALEQRNLENDSWFAFAAKLAEILAKVSTLERYVASLYQAISVLQEGETDPVLRDVLKDEDEKFTEIPPLPLNVNTGTYL